MAETSLKSDESAIYSDRLMTAMASEATSSQDQEFKDIATYTECDSAKVTGIITDVSPMTPAKKGTEYVPRNSQ